ncbi:Cold shock protein [Thalictrum thalictroides]|uniref:Cold shock protein n=1 Tax=Thalictrum thalictroides TaxID=46969 RepID=A0A7J6UYH9_THATH|nr:Cold shock protein [Thalictrum thalictroides]
MVKKRGSKEKLIEEEAEEKSLILLSSDDDEANEDLSLQIVEKARLRESKRKREADDFVFDADDGLRSSSVAAEGVIDLSSSSCEDVKLLDRNSGGNNGFVVDVRDTEEPMGTVISLETEQGVVVETNKLGDTVKADEKVELEETEAVQTSDNIVLRKLLRGPRYFDPPDRNCATCYSCGEEGHNAANCSKKRKKPCFICGSFDHGIRNCTQGQDCFICKNRGHRAKDCPEKHQRNTQENKICLRCGDFGHLMFSCSRDYDPEDLEEIQCYVCKGTGHLCCVASIDPGHKEVSCYNCGQSGHTGTGCAKYRGEASAASPSTCYKCGEEGHFARGCTNYSKPDRRMGEASTPTKKHSKKGKELLGSRSAPPNLSKVHKKKNIQHEEKDFAAEGRSKRRGGWIPDDPRDISKRKAKNNGWRSPATPTKNGQKNPAETGGSHSSNSRPPRWKCSPTPRIPSLQGSAYPSNHTPRAVNAHDSAYPSVRNPSSHGSAYTSNSTPRTPSVNGSVYPRNPPRTPSAHGSAYSSNLTPRTPNVHGSAYPPHTMAPAFYPPYPVTPTPGLDPYQNVYTPSRFSNSIGSGGRRYYW